jgi:hypothetical protein
MIYYFDFAAGILERINDFDVDVFETVDDLDFDILKRVYNLYFAVELVGLTIFGNGTVVLVDFDIRCVRTDNKGHAEEEG